MIDYILQIAGQNMLQVVYKSGANRFIFPDSYGVYESRYQVKKGQKAIAQFPIWKYTSKKKAEEVSEEEAQARGYCFMKMSSFFSTKQVEPIT